MFANSANRINDFHVEDKEENVGETTRLRVKNDELKTQLQKQIAKNK